MNIKMHVLITGDVTGVGFRYWTKMQAKRLNLTGWVRNTPEAQVEAVFEGPEEKVDEIIRLCRVGPEISLVEKVEAVPQELSEEFEDFNIIK